MCHVIAHPRQWRDRSVRQVDTDSGNCRFSPAAALNRTRRGVGGRRLEQTQFSDRAVALSFPHYEGLVNAQSRGMAVLARDHGGSDPTATAKPYCGLSRNAGSQTAVLEVLDADRTDALEAPHLRAAPDPALFLGRARRCTDFSVR